MPARYTVGMTDLVQTIIDHYLHSGDFNGYAYRDAVERFSAKEVLQALMDESLILLDESLQPNPFIKFWRGVGKSSDDDILGVACLYPTGKALADIDLRSHDFTRYQERLARGDGQMEFEIFETHVLDTYLQDPRNEITRYDYGFDIIPHASQAPIQHIARAFNVTDDGVLSDTACAIQLRYLAQLTERDAARLHSFEHATSADFTVHPDWVRVHLSAEFPEGITPFRWFAEALECINAQLTNAYGHGIFKTTQTVNAFDWLTVPTVSEYNAFCAAADKLFADNIDSKGLDAIYAPTENAKGEELTGTMSRFKQWFINLRIVINDKAPGENSAHELFRPFGEIRKTRSKHSHRATENEYDPGLYEQQQDLIMRACRSLHAMIGIIQEHPKNKALAIPERLRALPDVI